MSNVMRSNTALFGEGDGVKIHYVVDFTRCHDHLVDVTMTFDVSDDVEWMDEHTDPVLWLPTWIAGSYLIREFSRNITAVYFCDESGASHRATKISKNQYQLTGLTKHWKQGYSQQVRVRYEVYCHDLSVRTAFVDGSRLFGNFTSLLLMLTGAEQALSQVQLVVPECFLKHNVNAVLACGLPHIVSSVGEDQRYTLASLPAFEYYDYPFEFGVQSAFTFEVRCQNRFIAHRFFIAGQQRADLIRLSMDVQKICQSYVDLLGDAPFADYTFLTMVTGSEYGGLEHINSTALITPRTDLPTKEGLIPSETYQRFLGLCSHEYFHAWWVKSVRPDVMMQSDLQTEAYTPLLWVFEGFTSYLDDLMLLVSGMIDHASYFKLITAQINRYHQTDGRHHQSVAESSFDTWIKLYRPDENTNNQSVSYYNKGALVALCLDLLLLKHSDGNYRLFDVVKAFYNQSKQAEHQRIGMTDEHLGEVVAQMMGTVQWRDFYERYVVGVDELPLLELLGEFGVELTVTKKETVWGMSVDEVPSGLKIKHLYRDSTASRAGLSVGDVIIAINGIRANMAGIQSAFVQDDVAQVHAFRRDELHCFDVVCHTSTHHQVFAVAAYQEKGWLEFGRWMGS